LREGPASRRAPVLDLSVGLVGHWTFDEGRGTRVGDASGNGNGGVLKKMSTSSAWVAGCPSFSPNRHALRFDGKDDYVEVRPSRSLDTPNGLTITCWARLNQIKTIREDHTFVGKWGPGRDGVGESFIFWVGESAPHDELCFWASAGPWSTRAGTQISHTTNADIRPGRWHHVAVVWRANETPVFYQDGLALDSVQKGGPYKRTIPRIQRTQTPIKLGQGDRNPPRGIHRLDGELDEVRIYSRALSAEEVTALANVPALGTTEPR